jgi:exodeoxyribonuclease VII large subunit
MTRAKLALEGVRVRVVGEVSEFNDKAGYKAAYFTVCDGGAAMPCLMWRDLYDASGIALRCGMLVELSGQFSAYVPKGRMQFTVRSLALAGEGRLRIQVADLARKLEVEGLMRPERKRTLPRYPQRIAVVTSPRGKAIHDVLRTLRRRYPLAEVLVAGVQVEGEGAPEALVEGLRIAQQADPDVIVLVRGGGSYEDLMPFNAEEVARAVAGSAVPVVTGIGHEPDTSIADMVADLRASTPTAAAEAVAPSIEELAVMVARERRAIARALQGRVDRLGHQILRLAERPVFTDPFAILGPAAQRIDTARVRLERALPEKIARERQRVGFALDRMVGVGPRITERAAAKIGLAAARLEDLSPLAILARGYSASFGADGRTVVRSIDQVSEGDRMQVRVSDGRIGCVVTDTADGGTDG